MRRKKELEAIIDHYGIANQLDKSIEELSELIKAIVKLRIAVSKKENTKDGIMDAVAEEMADVKIMLAQLEIIFGNVAEVESFMDYKIKRQLRRMDRINISQEEKEDE